MSGSNSPQRRPANQESDGVNLSLLSSEDRHRHDAKCDVRINNVTTDGVCYDVKRNNGYHLVDVKKKVSVTSSSLSEQYTNEKASVDSDDGEKRGRWGNRLEFFLAIMGYTVGVGSVWRFPIICR